MTTVALRALADIARDRATREGLIVQLEHARARVLEAEQRHEDAVVSLAGEIADVEQLEAGIIERRASLSELALARGALLAPQ
jgi:hypothetical protein